MLDPSVCESCGKTVSLFWMVFIMSALFMLGALADYKVIVEQKVHIFQLVPVSAWYSALRRVDDHRLPKSSPATGTRVEASRVTRRC